MCVHACVCMCVRPPGCRPRLPRTLGPSWELQARPSALCLVAAGAGVRGPGVMGSRGGPQVSHSPDALPGPAVGTCLLWVGHRVPEQADMPRAVVSGVSVRMC